MADYRSISDSLKHEVLSEMADNYFGARRDIDHLLEEFDRLTDRLAVQAKEVERHGGLVHALLLDEEGAPEFYRVLEVDPADVPFGFAPGAVAVPDGLPRALTARGRWFKTLRRAYEAYWITADDYMHGHMEPDPEDPRRKRRTLHYNFLAALAARINERIASVRKGLCMDDALDYARSLDPVKQERERMLGAGAYCERGSGEDDGFEPIDFEYLGLRPMPELPETVEAWSRAKPWLGRFYADHREAIRKVMEDLRQGRGRFSPSA